MAETEIPADVRRQSHDAAMRYNANRDMPGHPALADVIADALMLDRAARAPDPSRDGVVEKAKALNERVAEAARDADKVLGGPEGETILGYTIPTGKWLMLQADLRNFLSTIEAAK